MRRLSQRGSALPAVLLVMALAGMLVAALLVLSLGNARDTVRRRDASESFFAAEAGIEAGKLAFEKTNQVFGIPRLSGSVGSATFNVRPGVGNFGHEAWPQWAHDAAGSRRDADSNMGPNLRPGWVSSKSPARNGASIGTSFYTKNIFTVVASGLVYSSYENPVTGKVQLAAFDELDGSLYWTTEASNLLGNGVHLTAPAAVPETNTLYVALTSGTALTDTVRLLALNVSPTGVSLKWTFDTGIHGIATAPAVYDPDSSAGGEEIVYFGVAATPDWDLLDLSAAYALPLSGNGQEGVHLFAVADTGPSAAPKTCKWLHPFPDPEIETRTDYPTETWPAATGNVKTASMVAPYPPDDDLVVDYLNASSPQFAVRGDMYVMFDPHSLGPPALQVDDGGTPHDPSDDVIHVYLYYTVVIDRDVTFGYYSETIPSPRQIRWQCEVAALRDTPSGRFPQLEWTADPPPFDPTLGDAIPADGYGTGNWDTFFEQQIGPLVARTTVRDDMVPLPDRDGDGQPDPNTVVYVPYESLGFASSGAYNNADPRAFSRAMVMAFQDTFDDWTKGLATGKDGQSRPVEVYWSSAGGDGGAYTARPYTWSEQDLDASGELGVAPYVGITRSADIDVEGETMAYDQSANLIYFVFNHDLWPTSANMESLRIHAVDATHGTLVWKHSFSSGLAGDTFNATPSLAGGYVFMMDTQPNARIARLNILHGNDGTSAGPSPVIVDSDADSADLAPTIANDAVYVGTYDDIDKVQRMFALSPNVWLLSTGDSADGKGHRTLAMLQKDGSLTQWREGGFSGGNPP